MEPKDLCTPDLIAALHDPFSTQRVAGVWLHLSSSPENGPTMEPGGDRLGVPLKASSAR